MDLDMVMATTAAEYIKDHYHIGVFLQTIIFIAATPILLLALVGFPGTMAGAFCYFELHWSLLVSIAIGLVVMFLWFGFLALES